MSDSTKMADALALIQKQGMIRPRDLAAHNIPMDYLHRLHQRGMIERVGRGLYASTQVHSQVTEHYGLVLATRQVSAGIICLLSALRYHELTTQNPRQVWMAIPSRAWHPMIEYPRLKIVRYSERSMSTMIESHWIEGTVVKLYNPAKTVVDCFKFRNKVGIDVAIEALRDCRRQRKATMDELHIAAKICRMTNVMRPYLESMI